MLQKEAFTTIVQKFSRKVEKVSRKIDKNFNKMQKWKIFQTRLKEIQFKAQCLLEQEKVTFQKFEKI